MANSPRVTAFILLISSLGATLAWAQTQVPADPRVKTEIAAIDAQIAEADSENGKYGGAGKGPD